MSEINPNPNRPDPIMTVDGARFWKAADEKRFIAQKCGGCERLWHPPRAICPECFSMDQRDHDLSGRGTIISWVMPIHPPAIGFETPPIVVLVETEEGPRYVSNIEGVDPRDMRYGMKVEVAYTTTKSGQNIPIFRPAKEA
ncbi:DNA-binding protein [Sphingomonas sp. DBB INV C78]|uniref:Zn-ribbon domain-containing OB-fold protein n=1 Tax=Sphingomonas sp. DBB INV C78 TaxID=3349434 RepID=UPI0036D3869B